MKILLIKRLIIWTISLVCSIYITAISATAVFAGENPSEVRIALMYSVGPEASWDTTVKESLIRLQSENPGGMEIKFKAFDAVYGDEAEKVMNLVAKSGKHDIILSASAHSDQIKNLQGKYPEIMWVSLGSGNYNTGKNHYLVYGRAHQAAYILGVLAGKMSKSGVIGVVGSFPANDVNDQINAYRAGAQSVNENVKMKLTFIESWYDPPKATESTLAQAAAGADVVYQMAGEIFKACEDAKIFCFSKYRDYSSMSPSTVLSGTVLNWDPGLKWILDEWRKYKANDTPYNGNTDPRWFSMADGGSDIFSTTLMSEIVPDDVKAKIQATKAAIIAGELVVPVVMDTPTSD